MISLFCSPCINIYARCGRHVDAGDERGAKVASTRAPATVIIIRPALQKTREAKRRDSSLISAYGRNPLSLLVRRGRAASQIPDLTLPLVQADHYYIAAATKPVYARDLFGRFRRFSIRRASVNSPRQLRDYNSELIQLAILW